MDKASSAVVLTAAVVGAVVCLGRPRFRILIRNWPALSDQALPPLPGEQPSALNQANTRDSLRVEDFGCKVAGSGSRMKDEWFRLAVRFFSERLLTNHMSKPHCPLATYALKALGQSKNGHTSGMVVVVNQADKGR